MLLGESTSLNKERDGNVAKYNVLDRKREPKIHLVAKTGVALDNGYAEDI